LCLQYIRDRAAGPSNAIVKRFRSKILQSLQAFVKRLSRLSLGFSKKLGNLKAAVALHVFHYNFCRIHSSIRCTPAMRANLTDHIWKLKDLFGG
jgi:hypothetical protein